MKLSPYFFVKFVTLTIVATSVVRAGTEMQENSYCGIYRCCDSVESAGLLLLKVDDNNLSFLMLAKAFDDPTKAHIISPKLVINSREIGVKTVHLEGSGNASFDATISVTKGVSKHLKASRDVQFMLDWLQGSTEKADEIVITILGENGDKQVLHFHRKL